MNWKYVAYNFHISRQNFKQENYFLQNSLQRMCVDFVWVNQNNLLVIIVVSYLYSDDKDDNKD